MTRSAVFDDDLEFEDYDADSNRDDDDEIDPLEAFLDDGTITEVIGEVKSGKEGTVYCCRGSADLQNALIAAKVFRSRKERTFRNQTVYREGQVILNKRDERALKRKSSWGRQFEYGSWMYHEFEVLQMLSRAGADVPNPIRMGDRVILMQYIGTDEGPAPKLQAVDLSPLRAQAVFDQIMENIRLFLREELVHGDLSPYNILWHENRPVIIDFPQAVDPRFNRQTLSLLERDVSNVCRYFEKHGVSRDPEAITRNLWARYQRAQL